MNKEYEKNIEQIEAYLQNRLSISERKSIEAKAANDPRFRALLAEEEKLYSALKDKEAISFLRTVHNVIEDHVEVGKIRKLKWNRPFLAIAASILLIATFYFLFQPSSNHADLYKENFEVYPLLNTVRSSTQVSSLQSAYDNKEWTSVVEILENESIPSIPDPMIDVYLGLGYLESGQILLAIKSLEPYQNEQINPMYQELIDWYLSLAYLKNDETQKCILVLDRILSRNNDSSKIYRKAASLRSRL